MVASTGGPAPQRSPLRRVVEVRLEEYRDALETAPQGRVVWMWLLQLECGHVEHRTVRYLPPRPESGQARGRGHRDLDDALPAPLHARCDECIADR